MTAAPKISLAQQIEALGVAATRQQELLRVGRVQELRPKNAAEYDLQRLQAATRTLLWLRDNLPVLEEFLALPKEARDAAIAMAKEIDRKQAIARAGGPAR